MLFDFERDASHLQFVKGVGDTVRKMRAAEMLLGGQLGYRG